MIPSTLASTRYNFPGQTSMIRGKVRDIYHIDNDILVMIATDRISAFDVVLPHAIPFKGQVLNQIASLFLDATASLVPNWKIAEPDPMVTLGRRCRPFEVEMVIRGYLSGSAWRSYKNGNRNICGVKLADRMREHQQFKTPVITPTTKATQGHDLDIAPQEIITKGLMTKEEYQQIEEYTRKLFDFGTAWAKKRGLILVDTKYEFGKDENGQILLIDEVHTPDSSRYFVAETYQQDFEKGERQRQLSKEFVREWLMANGFHGAKGQQVPDMSDEFVMQVSERYIELFEKITGQEFVKTVSTDLHSRIEQHIVHYLNTAVRPTD